MITPTRSPALIRDIDTLRSGVATAGDAGTRRGELWSAVLRCARGAPLSYPWLTPFVALVTGEAADIRAARLTLDRYRAKLDPVAFGSGIQYHFWCFAFPHAKWCLYQQWLETLGAYTPEESREIRREFLIFAYTNFLYGLRSKPEPECIDNQALSLALSCALIGWLYADDVEGAEMAAILRDEGTRRLPGILGGLPRSGYCGEGSSYMDCVIGPAVPLVVELLEAAGGESGVFTRNLPPNGVSPLQICRMVAREWLPGGLLLPWDNYGYQYGVRATLAYAARASGEPLFRDLLENDAIWSYDIGVGWAYDDLAWTIAWWPEEVDAGPSTGSDWSWFERETGGAIGTRARTLVQIWDDSEPTMPARRHVNPNALTLCVDGIPLTVDGTPVPGPNRFDFDDSWKTVTHHIGVETRYNFGSGCLGAHGAIIVDGVEGLRAARTYPQLRDASAAADGRSIRADVTPLYAERWPDIRRVERQSTYHADRFFLVEDLFLADREHTVATRYLLRPSRVEGTAGPTIETREGARLQLVPLGPAAHPRVEAVEGFPDCLDRSCLLVDWVATGKRVHRMHLLWPGSSRVTRPLDARWTAIADPGADLTPGAAGAALDRSTLRLPFRMPAFMEADVEVTRRWWYRLTVPVEDAPQVWLRLPRNLMEPRLWVNGREIEMEAGYLSRLVQPQVPLPADLCAAGSLEILVRTDVPVSHWEGAGWGTTGLNGVSAFCYPTAPETVTEARWRDGLLTVRTDRRVYTSPYTPMEEP